MFFFFFFGCLYFFPDRRADVCLNCSIKATSSHYRQRAGWSVRSNSSSRQTKEASSIASAPLSPHQLQRTPLVTARDYKPGFSGWADCERFFSGLSFSENSPFEYNLYLLERIWDEKWMFDIVDHWAHSLVAHRLVNHPCFVAGLFRTCCHCYYWLALRGVWQAFTDASRFLALMPICHPPFVITFLLRQQKAFLNLSNDWNIHLCGNMIF